MNWPWVSRTAYEDMRDSRDYERENAQYLRRELVSLFRPPRVAPVKPWSVNHQSDPEPTATDVVVLPDPIREVIREQSILDGREDHQLASHLRRYARQLKREGKTQDEISAALVAWQTSEVAEGST